MAWQSFASVAMHTYSNPMSLGLGADARKIFGIMVSGNVLRYARRANGVRPAPMPGRRAS